MVHNPKVDHLRVSQKFEMTHQMECSLSEVVEEARPIIPNVYHELCKECKVNLIHMLGGSLDILKECIELFTDAFIQFFLSSH